MDVYDTYDMQHIILDICQRAFLRQSILLRNTVVQNRNLIKIHVYTLFRICINNDRTFDRIDFIELGSVHSHSV